MQNKKLKYTKRIRIKDFSYKGFYRYFVTICLNNKEELFNSSIIVNKILNIIKELSEKYKFKIWAYCFMPDHLHLLVEGIDENSDFKKFISMIKQKSGFWFQNSFNKKLWENNYYEHVSRREEATREIILYIFGNPVRKGIVKQYTDYPFLGSFELKDLII